MHFINVQFWIGHRQWLLIEIQTHLFPIDLIALVRTRKKEQTNKLWRCFLLAILLYLFFFSILIRQFYLVSARTLCIQAECIPKEERLRQRGDLDLDIAYTCI